MPPTPPPSRPHKLVHLGAPVQLNPSLMGMPGPESERLAQQAFREAQAQAEFLVSDAQQQANDVLAEAQTQAEALLAQARQQADDLLAGVDAEVTTKTQAGYDQGYTDGHQQGTADCAAQLAEQLATAQLLAQQALTFSYHVQQQLSSSCVELMQALLTSLLGEAWAADKASLLTLALNQALDAQHEEGQVQLVVHPSHLAHLQAHGLTCQAPLKLVGDPLLAPTDALVVVDNDPNGKAATVTLFSPALLNATLATTQIVTKPKAEKAQKV